MRRIDEKGGENGMMIWNNSSFVIVGNIACEEMEFQSHRKLMQLFEEMP